MVSVNEHFRISDHPELDRRRKLTDEQRRDIRDAWFGVHEAERPTLTALGQQFGVHRTQIARILDPERDKRQNEDQKQRARDGRYYKKDRHRINQKRYAQYKKQLLLQRKLSN